MSAGFLGAGGSPLSRFGSVESVKGGHFAFLAFRPHASSPVTVGGFKGIGGLRRFGDVTGAKSGSGTLVAGSATVSGTASRVIYDLGTYDELIAGEATVSGTGAVSGTGISTGVLVCGSATVSGYGTVEGGWSTQPTQGSTWTKKTPVPGGWKKQ